MDACCRSIGESDVSIQVTDPDGATATQEFKIKVSKSGGPPSIRSVPATEAAIGIGYLYSIVAHDAEGDPLTFRLLATPAGMTIAENTGVISWTPTADQLGEQDVVIQVSDGIGGAVTQAFAIRVSAGAPNLPPVINSIAPRFGVVGQTYRYMLAATDPEATQLRYSLGQAPVEMTIDPISGIVSWTPTQPFVGKSVVTFIVTDAGGATAVESFELDVLAANSQPTIVSTAPVDTPAGAVFTYQVLGRDVDLDQLTYELTIAPDGATIDSFGKITWPTTPALIGPHNFAVRVSDPRGGVATQSFTLSVIEDVVPPKVSLIESLGDANRNVLPWQGPFVVYVRAIDNVAIRSLTLKANGRDIPLDPAGTATFTFEDWEFQSINVTATAVDTNGNIATKAIQFDYDFPEGWDGGGTEDIPMVAITSPTDTAAVFGMVTLTGTASHADFAGYKLSYRRIDETTFTQFHESTTAVVNGTLGVWDTSLLINDEYVIRLEAASNTGVVNVVEHNVGLSGELKLGSFQISLEDMTIPVAGIPLTIARTYDSLSADREGDFGFGWRLEFRNTDLRTSLRKSGLEDIGIYTPFRQGTRVFITLPGGRREGFTFTPRIRVLPGFGGQGLAIATPRFTPDRGVRSTLSTAGGNLLVNASGELMAPGGIPWNPASPDFGGYTITTQDGFRYSINGNGDLTRVLDRNDNMLTFSDNGVSGSGGTTVTLERDAQGRIIAAIDPLGNAVRYGFSSAGDLISVTDREGNITRYEYRTNPAHYLDRIIDPLGRTGIRNEYDANGRLIRAFDLHGNPFIQNFDLENGREFFTDRNGATSIRRFDALGNVLEETDATGATTRYTYDSSGNILTSTNQAGEVSRFTYDSVGKLTSQTNELGLSTQYLNNRNGDVLSVTDPLGHTTKYSYDSRGNIVERTDPTGAITSYELDVRGNRVSEIDERGGVTKYAYDSAGRLISKTDALETVLSTAFDKAGRANSESITVTGPNGPQIRTTTIAYDKSGRAFSAVNPIGARVEFGYDASGFKTVIIDPLNRRIEQTNVGFERAGQYILPDGRKTELLFDENGRQIGIKDPSGRVNETVNDGIDRPLSQSYGGATQSVEYSIDGREINLTRPNGDRTGLELDAAGRLTLMSNQLGHTIRYQYDAADRRTAVIDSTNRITRFEYDAVGRLTKTIYPDNSSELRAYDPSGNLISIADATGAVTRYEYDLLDRLTAVVSPLGFRTEYAYNQASELIEQRDTNGHLTTYEYDPAGRLSAVVRPGNGRTI